jgi:hypothetical protein
MELPSDGRDAKREAAAAWGSASEGYGATAATMSLGVPQKRGELEGLSIVQRRDGAQHQVLMEVTDASTQRLCFGLYHLRGISTAAQILNCTAGICLRFRELLCSITCHGAGTWTRWRGAGTSGSWHPSTSSWPSCSAAVRRCVWPASDTEHQPREQTGALLAVHLPLLPPPCADSGGRRQPGWPADARRVTLSPSSPTSPTSPTSLRSPVRRVCAMRGARVHAGRAG